MPAARLLLLRVQSLRETSRAPAHAPTSAPRNASAVLLQGRRAQERERAAVHQEVLRGLARLGGTGWRESEPRQSKAQRLSSSALHPVTRTHIASTTLAVAARGCCPLAPSIHG
eukprot:3682883-Alexandrium_andersonii.AAC.3